MNRRAKLGIAIASTAGVVAGAAVVGYGLTGSAAADAPKVVHKAGEAYRFVDENPTRDKAGLTYKLPTLPPGPYSVSVFSRMDPADDSFNDNFGCELDSNTEPYGRILVMTAQWTGVDVPFVTGASTTRIAKNTEVRLSCYAEHGAFRYDVDSMRVTFVRLASLKTETIEPTSAF